MLPLRAGDGLNFVGGHRSPGIFLFADGVKGGRVALVVVLGSDPAGIAGRIGNPYFIDDAVHGFAPWR